MKEPRPGTFVYYKGAEFIACRKVDGGVWLVPLEADHTVPKPLPIGIYKDWTEEDTFEMDGISLFQENRCQKQYKEQPDSSRDENGCEIAMAESLEQSICDAVEVGILHLEKVANLPDRYAICLSGDVAAQTLRHAENDT